ncbi:peptidylprolyl isomerase [Sphingopyxis sp.]|uniref:peptidylprolyl isomerase n=1 Tax=Sphingopyxis sp. TaxID=1908224 RepID=UPI0035B43A6A
MFSFLALSLAAAAQTVPAQTTQLPPPPPAVPAPVTAPVEADTRPYVELVTDAGKIVIRIENRRAPITAANFLRYVDSKRMATVFKFYRTTRSWGEGNALVQGGNRGDARLNYPPIAHEPTTVTGLTHCKGAVAMARLAPGDATSDFFILLSDIPGFDADPSASGDNAGFAVFGELVSGLDVAEKIYAAPVSPAKGEGVMIGQMLEPEFKILSARRIAAPADAPQGCVVKAAPRP